MTNGTSSAFHIEKLIGRDNYANWNGILQLIWSIKISGNVWMVLVLMWHVHHEYSDYGKSLGIPWYMAPMLSLVGV